MRGRAPLEMMLLALAASSAFALDYRSTTETAILYDAPSQKARPQYVIAAGTPVEAVVTLDTWVKVRDMKGDLVWIERRLLSDKRMLQVRAERAQIRTTPDEQSAIAFEAEPDVLLEFVEAAPSTSGGWVKVRHRDGPQGFVKASQIWGL